MSKPSPKGRPGFSLIEILVVVIMVGILFSISFQSFANARDRSSNAQVDGNIRQIQSALTVYQADNEKLPQFLVADTGTSLLEVPTAATRNVAYLPGNKLPRTPWTENWQGNNLNKGASNMPTATDAAAGFFRISVADTGSVKLRLPASPTKLIAGKLPAPPTNGVPGAVTFEYKHYGAVMYETNANQSLFILHGVGKFRADARVVALATNAR